MKDWQVVIPHIGPPDNLAGCLASMGEVTVPLLIVDNSKRGDTGAMKLPGGTWAIHFPQNFGVAASWNLGLRQRARWTLICSASMRFGEGGLSRLIDEASEAASSYGLLIYNAFYRCAPALGWHLIVIGHKTVETIGYFDENFYPAYYEDNDYGRRMALKGIVFPHITVPSLAHAGNAIALKARYVDGPSMSLGYYINKWGGSPSHELWERPFNDKTKGLDWWPKKT